MIVLVQAVAGREVAVLLTEQWKYLLMNDDRWALVRVAKETRPDERVLLCDHDGGCREVGWVATASKETQ